MPNEIKISIASYRHSLLLVYFLKVHCTEIGYQEYPKQTVIFWRPGDPLSADDKRDPFVISLSLHVLYWSKNPIFKYDRKEKC